MNKMSKITLAVMLSTMVGSVGAMEQSINYEGLGVTKIQFDKMVMNIAQPLMDKLSGEAQQAKKDLIKQNAVTQLQLQLQKEQMQLMRNKIKPGYEISPSKQDFIGGGTKPVSREEDFRGGEPAKIVPIDMESSRPVFIGGGTKPVSSEEDGWVKKVSRKQDGWGKVVEPLKQDFRADRPIGGFSQKLGMQEQEIQDIRKDLKIEQPRQENEPLQLQHKVMQQRQKIEQPRQENEPLQQQQKIEQLQRRIEPQQQ